MDGSFFDGIVSTNCGGSYNVGQYGVAEFFFKELNAFRAP
jgi:hypothetical protein